MNFVITYILAFFICHYVGEVFYLKSDKGLFSMAGFVPILNILLAVILALYIIYVLMDMLFFDKFRGPREKHGQYNRLLIILEN